MRKTTRTFKVFNNGSIYTVEGVKAFSNKLSNITGYESKKIWRTALAALDSSKKKMKIYLESGHVPRTKTSFLKTGVYLFDLSISDKDIENYMSNIIKC